MLVRVAATLCSFAIVGCYSPSIAPCIYTCAGEACPSGLTCNSDIHMCVASAGDTCNGADGGVDATICGWPSLSNVDPCLLGADTTADTWDASGSVNTDSLLGFPPSVHPVDVTMPGVGNRHALAVPVQAFSVQSGQSLDVAGERPLIIISRSAAMIDGTINLTATIRTPCAGILDALTYIGSGSSGGGGGGGNGGPGGPGGTGNTDESSAPGLDDTPAGMGGNRGATFGTDALAPLRSGCAGGTGGGDGGLGGAGGGGIQISSKIKIQLNAAILANGGGGLAVATVHAGGGGGGAGGSILLEAPTVSFGAAGLLCANGGGGGAGATSGNAGETAMGCETAGGGAGINAMTNGNGKGGRGGFGSSLTQRTGDPGNSPDSPNLPAYGGGGGGGGAGKIRINVEQTTGMLTTLPSPDASFGTLPNPKP